jgi:F420H(2)-dependent quinone reductase
MPGMNDFNEQLIEEFRANGGKVGGPFAGANLLLLHTTGAKSGRRRVNPLAYRRDGDHFVIFGSKGSSDEPRLVPQSSCAPERDGRGRDRAVRRDRQIPVIVLERVCMSTRR